MTSRRDFFHRASKALACLALAPKLARMGLETLPGFRPRDYRGEWVWIRAEAKATLVRMVYADGHWEDVPAECGHFRYQFKDPNPEWS